MYLTYDVVGAAYQLSLGRNKTLELISSGKLKSIRVGRRIIVPHCAIEDYIETQLSNASSEGNQK